MSSFSFHLSKSDLKPRTFFVQLIWVFIITEYYLLFSSQVSVLLYKQDTISHVLENEELNGKVRMTLLKAPVSMATPISQGRCVATHLGITKHSLKAPVPLKGYNKQMEFGV